MSYLINRTKYSEKEYYHSHKTYEIIYFFNGRGILNTKSNNFRVEKGNIVVIPPFCAHSTTGENLESIYVNGDFFNLFAFSEPVILRDDAKENGNALVHIIESSKYGGTEYLSALCNAYAQFILQNIRLDTGVGVAVSKIVNEITENFHFVDLSLEKLLINSGYAEDYIRHHFKKITGKTPVAFLTNVRIKHAMHLINIYKSTLSLCEIAEKCGYQDYSYFSKKFKRVTGMSPQSFANSQRIMQTDVDK